MKIVKKHTTNENEASKYHKKEYLLNRFVVDYSLSLIFTLHYTQSAYMQPNKNSEAINSF